MDLVLDLIATLSRWSRSHLSDISLAIMATLFVLFGPALNAWVQKGTSKNLGPPAIGKIALS